MKTLRQKAEYLLKLKIDTAYFRLLLRQNKITKEDKKIIEDLWKVVK